MKFTFQLIIFYLILTSSSYAYMDPGSTSIIIQMLISAVVGSIVAIKIYYFKLKTFFKKIFKKKKN